MKLSHKIMLVTILGAVVSFFLGPVLWPMPIGGVGPEGAQLPLFIVVGVLESVAFGLGLAFLLFGWPLVRRVPAPMRRTAHVLFFVVSWSLISWWPHDRMHMSNEESDIWRLLLIEYVFHVTLILAAIIAAYEVWQLMRQLTAQKTA